MDLVDRGYPEDNETISKQFKGDHEEPHHQIAIVIPIIGNRLQHNIATYGHWRGNGFDVVLVFDKDEEGAVTNILHQHPDMMTSSVMHPYTTSIPPNAGIAKHNAYGIILKQYLDRPNFQFALLLDDTVNDIVNTRTGTSIMTTPTEFYHAVIRFAEESPVFGGTVAPERHPEECKQEGIATVKGSFLQQALIFSCRGTPTLKKNIEADDYIAKMGRLSYRQVPFGEDVAFQVSLYEHGVLSKEKSPQFWGIGVSRIHHISSTKPSFDQLEFVIKEELKKMLIYLKKQNALSVDPQTNELRGVKVIPHGPKRISITGSKGERPWKEAFNYTFPCSKENNKCLVNRTYPS
jgi:hypothetical protein